MLAVSQLRPKRAKWSDIVALFQGGSYGACLAASRAKHDPREAGLRARAWMRLERYDEAVSELDLNDVNEKTVLRGELASIRSLSLALVGKVDESRDCQRDARAYLYSVDAPSLELELHLNEAKLAFVKGNLPLAKRIAENVRSQSNLIDDVADSVVVTAANVIADAGNLLAAIELSSDKRTSAVIHFTESLRLLRRSKIPDVGLIARILSNLSGSLEGIDSELELSALTLIRQIYETLNWTSDLAIHQFQVIRELGFASALDGDHLSAFREYKRAFNIAPKSQLKLQALLDRIFLGTELKQHLLAHADLCEAQELAAAIDWSHVDERDLSCLPTLAKLLAPIDLAAARVALRSYTDRKTKSTRTSSLFLDRRFHAEYLTAVAAIANAENNHLEAERLLIAAFEIFDGVGSDWRAAQVAFGLRKCHDPQFAAYAQEAARKRPNSWLAAKVMTG